MFNIKNKRILLVGASGVLGSEYTKMFLRQGTRLIVSDVDSKKYRSVLKNKKKLNIYFVI